jgi:hypothetical protein
MSSDLRQRFIRSEAIRRVLERPLDRSAIGSPADLRRAYQAELAAHRAEIEAHTDEVITQFRQSDTEMLSKLLRCAACDGPMLDAKRISRRYCSDSCRQSAHRKRRRGAP